MEDLLIILSIPLFVIFAVVYAIIRLVSFLKQQAQQGVGRESGEEYREELDDDLDNEIGQPSGQRQLSEAEIMRREMLRLEGQKIESRRRKQELDHSNDKQLSSTVVPASPNLNSSLDYDYDRQGVDVEVSDSFGVEDFDLRQAVIMSEILQPKFKNEE